MTKDEALKLALEAFNKLAAWNDGEVGCHMDEPYAAEVAREAINAVKAALEAKDEYLAYLPPTPIPENACYIPPQRTWVGLTDEDWFELAKAQHGWGDLLIAAEAKLRSKNT